MQTGKLKILLARPRIDEGLHGFASERVVRFGRENRFHDIALVFEQTRIINVRGGYVEFEFYMGDMSYGATVGPDDYVIVRIDPSFYISNHLLCVDCGRLTGQMLRTQPGETTNRLEMTIGCKLCGRTWYIALEEENPTWAYETVVAKCILQKLVRAYQELRCWLRRKIFPVALRLDIVPRLLA